LCEPRDAFTVPTEDASALAVARAFEHEREAVRIL
jgi:hypothetical protein